jgi:ribosome-associated translation inhibitor RaiA
VTGGVPPLTFVEYVFSSATMFFTCGFFGFMVSSISRIVDQKLSKKREFMNDLETINRFMAKKQISEGVRVEVNQYMENLYLQEQESQTQQVHHIIDKLSQRLKMEIAREANSRLL